MVRDHCSQGWEQGGQKHTDITDINGDVQVVQHMVEWCRCDHQTRVDGATNDTAQRVPGTVIKPVVKLIEPFLRKEPGGSIVEVGIELVNNTLKSQHREETAGKCWK